MRSRRSRRRGSRKRRRRREEGGRRKEEGGRRKEEGGRKGTLTLTRWMAWARRDAARARTFMAKARVRPSDNRESWKAMSMEYTCLRENALCSWMLCTRSKRHTSEHRGCTATCAEKNEPSPRQTSVCNVQPQGKQQPPSNAVPAGTGTVDAGTRGGPCGRSARPRCETT
jgi:hypothetical protein